MHDLSQLSEREARSLLARAATAHLCVRYLHDAQGEIVFGAPLVAATTLVKAKRFAAAAPWRRSVPASSVVSPLGQTQVPPKIVLVVIAVVVALLALGVVRGMLH